MDSQNKPDFFIVGAPKCGTTSLCYYLSQHPEIFMPEEKEPNFFNTDIVHYKRDLEEYLNLFSDHRHELCGEGSAWYLYSNTAAQAIKQFNPQAKIIIALRDPVALIESLHSENMVCGYETIKDLPRAIEAEALRKNGQLAVKSATLKQRWYCHDWYLYRNVAAFSNQVKRYLEHFDHENIHFVIFDDLCKDTRGEYKRLLQFLGAENTDFEPEFDIQRSNRQVKYSRFYSFFAAPPDSLIRFIRRITPNVLKPVISKLGWQIISGAKRVLTIPKARQSNDLTFRTQLKQQFESEVMQLSKLLNRDLTHWVSR
ncbi:MAG: sulfotransferase [Cyanobacteria bacterium P01_A01_bin.123]